jgi:phosphotriesterase-related protein
MEVQTVTGSIGLDQLGRTLMHEHLFIAFPGAEFDPSAKFDRAGFVTEAVRRLRQLRTEHGVRSFVDPCPIELGRDAAMMREIAEKSEMNIICTTGFYFEEMGLPVYWRARTTAEIADLYIREITHGIGTTGVRAGAIKVATGAPGITALEQKFLEAACIAQQATNVPIITHTQDGCAGPEQQAAFAAGGVSAHRCLIGHCCGNADPAYHRRVVDGGSYIGFDRIGIIRLQPDEVRADNLVRLVRSGHRAQIMMSQDRHCGWLGKFARQVPAEEQARIETLREAGKWPPPYTYLFTDFVPMLKDRGLSEHEIDAILHDNPRRFFAGEPLPRLNES